MKRKSLFTEFFHYASAQVFGMIGLSVYILADTFFIAQALGADGLAALNLAIPVYNAVSGIGVMLGVGGAIGYTIARGRGEEGHNIIRAALAGALGCSAFMVAAGLFLARLITAFLGADRDVFAMTETYVRVILLFSPAFICNQVLQSFVRNDGNPRLSMLAMLGGSAANIVLDYLFMFPCRMGIFGAVLATGIAPVMSMLILSPHFRGGRRRKLFYGRPAWRSLPRTLAIGFPTFIGEISAGVVMVAFNFIMLDLGGNVAVAAYGVIANLAIMMVCIMNGIAQGVQPLLSAAHGTGDRNALRRLLGYAVGAVMLVATLLYGAFLLGAEQIVAIFNSQNDSALQEIAVPGLRLYFSATWFVGLNTLLISALSATERAFPAQMVSIARGIAVIVPAAFLLSALWGMAGAWLAYPTAEGLVLAAALGWLAISWYCARKKRPNLSKP